MNMQDLKKALIEKLQKAALTDNQKVQLAEIDQMLAGVAERNEKAATLIEQMKELLGQVHANDNNIEKIVEMLRQGQSAEL